MDFIFKFSKKQLIISLICVGFLVYANALFNKFVWDDYPFILNNPQLKDFNLLQIFSQNKFNAGSYYRPLSALYFTILFNIAGSKAFLYHFIQISLHILNSIFIYLVLEKLFLQAQVKPTEKFEKTATITSFIASLIFLIHPLNVESVAYIASSQSELFFLFGILAFWLSQSENNTKNLILIFTFSLFSILVKETGIIFLLTISVYHFLFFPKESKKIIFTEACALTVYIFIRIGIGGIFLGKFMGNFPVPIGDASLLERIYTIPQIIYYYMVNTVLPIHLITIQSWVVKYPDFKSFLLPLIFDMFAFSLVTFIGFYVYKEKQLFKVYLLFLLWFLVSFFMIMQIFPLDATVEDRWFYLPFVGFLGMFVTAGVKFFSSENSLYLASKYKNIIIFMVFIVLALFSLRTVIRNSNYSDEITLFEHDAKINDNFLIESDLGIDYLQQGNKDQGFLHLKKSVELEPHSFNLFNLGFYNQITGNVVEAERLYAQAINKADNYHAKKGVHFPNDEKIYTNLAGILLVTHRSKGAVGVAKKGLTIYKSSVVLMQELAVGEYILENENAALDAAEKARKIKNNEISNQVYDMIYSNQEVPLELIIKIVKQL